MVNFLSAMQLFASGFDVFGDAYDSQPELLGTFLNFDVSDPNHNYYRCGIVCVEEMMWKNFDKARALIRKPKL